MNWKQVSGWPYEVSDTGMVRRVGSDAARKLMLFKKTGYLGVDLYDAPRHKKFLVHRLVAIAFIGDPPAGHDVAHGDGTRTNNVLSNLRWATKAENQADRIKHGTAMTGDDSWSRNNPDRICKGSKHRLSKLREEDIPSIRNDPRTCSDIAKDYGVVPGAISNVKKRTTWKHVP